MDQEPLVIEEIEAGEEFARRFDAYKPVKAAFWLKTSDEWRRHLYIASDEIDATNRLEAYREVSRLADPMRSFYFDALRVKLIDGDSPLARAVTDLLNRFPRPQVIRFRDEFFGEVMV